MGEWLFMYFVSSYFLHRNVGRYYVRFGPFGSLERKKINYFEGRDTHFSTEVEQQISLYLIGCVRKSPWEGREATKPIAKGADEFEFINITKVIQVSSEWEIICTTVLCDNYEYTFLTCVFWYFRRNSETNYLMSTIVITISCPRASTTCFVTLLNLIDSTLGN